MPQFTAIPNPSTDKRLTHGAVRIRDLRLHRAAAPAMAAVHQDLHDLEVALLLADDGGRVIDRWARNRSSGTPTAPSAISSALRDHRQPVVSDRCDDGASPACTARAVSDPGTGELIGVIAVTYPGWTWQPLMQALIGRIVHETRERLLGDAVAVPPWSSLTRAERNVVRYVAMGFTNRETAEKLFVSAHTVDYHLRRVFQKLGLRSRVELAHLAGIGGDAEAVCC